MTPTTTTMQPAAVAPPHAPPVAGFLLAAAITLSAFLLFQVQPLIGKFILPWFGGAAGVWTTCMIFFQVMLLAGYAYAHLSVTYLRPRGQAIIHAVLVLAAVMSLPVIPTDHWKPAGPAEPAPRILALLLVTLGLPYFVLSATAPLLQSWFARLFPKRSPYRLYALSNAASLAALLTFPFLIEPLLSRQWQAYGWSAGFVAFGACLAACIAFVWKSPGATIPVAPGVERSPAGAPGDAPDAPPRTPPMHYALWLLLPACASLMFLAVTNKLCLDVAAVPFLWIVPLALYLVTFILCFDSPRWYRRRYAGPLLVAGIAVGCVALLRGSDWGIGVNVAAFCFALFACCMACHGELISLRPDPRRLTAFYLLIAAGGAAGGIFVGLIAPRIFDQFIELHLGLGLTWLLFLAALAADPGSALHGFRSAFAWYGLITLSALIFAFLYGHVALRFSEIPIIERSRNFYGVVQVHEGAVDGAGVVIMEHNGITHGMQYKDYRRRMEPTTYYGPASGIGRLVSNFSTRPLRMGVVGLGTGNLAAGARRDDVVRFYEIDPEVERLARVHFTFLSDSPAAIDVVLGDARLSMEREAPQAYDVLALDAFSGDAIPVHLLTRAAMATYLRHLAPDGVIAFHTTNRHLDLSPVVNGLVRHYGLHAVIVVHNDPPWSSEWLLAARQPALLDPFRAGSGDARSFVITPATARLWTDDYASLFPIVSLRRRH